MTIQDRLSEFRVPFVLGGHHRHVRRGWIGVDCPRCGRNSSKYHAAINTQTFASHCWRCGRLDVVSLLSDLTGVPPRAVYRWVAKGREEFTPSDEAPKPKGKLVLPNGLGPLKRPHKEYLVKRNLDPARAEAIWGLQGIGLAARLAWRIWIPGYLDGRVVSWTTRSIGNAPIRYLSAPPECEEVPAKDLLWGEDYCCQTVVVCEGPFDAMRIGPGAVATVGLGVSDRQMARIARYPMRVICFDNEPAARRRADAIAAALVAYPGDTCVARIESGKDAAEADEGEIREIRRLFLDE